MPGHYEESSVVEPEPTYQPDRSEKPRTPDPQARDGVDNAKATSPSKENPPSPKKQPAPLGEKLASTMKPLNLPRRAARRDDRPSQATRHLILSGPEDFSQSQKSLINRPNPFVPRGELPRDPPIDDPSDFDPRPHTAESSHPVPDQDQEQEQDERQNEGQVEDETEAIRYTKSAYNRDAMAILTINKHHRDQEVFQGLDESDLAVVRALYQQLSDSKKNYYLNAALAILDSSSPNYIGQNRPYFLSWLDDYRTGPYLTAAERSFAAARSPIRKRPAEKRRSPSRARAARPLTRNTEDLPPHVAPPYLPPSAPVWPPPTREPLILDYSSFLPKNGGQQAEGFDVEDPYDADPAGRTYHHAPSRNGQRRLPREEDRPHPSKKGNGRYQEIQPAYTERYRPN